MRRNATGTMRGAVCAMARHSLPCWLCWARAGAIRMPKAATTAAASRSMAVTRCRIASGTRKSPPPLQLLVEAVVFLDGEAEPPEQPHRRVDLLDMDPQRLAA